MLGKRNVTIFDIITLALRIRMVNRSGPPNSMREGGRLLGKHNITLSRLAISQLISYQETSNAFYNPLKDALLDENIQTELKMGHCSSKLFSDLTTKHYKSQGFT